MSSSLKSQPNLEKIYGFRYLLLHFAYKYLFRKKPAYIMLVRNPYTRLESFFKDKLRESPLQIRDNNSWQDCQKIFFPHLGIQAGERVEKIRNELLNLSFHQFIKLLPELHFKDLHLAVQYFDGHKVIRKGILTLTIKCNIERIVKMEDKSNLEDLAQCLELDLSIHRNSTANMKCKIEWDDECRAIVQQIYREDFHHYKYPK